MCALSCVVDGTMPIRTHIRAHKAHAHWPATACTRKKRKLARCMRATEGDAGQGRDMSGSDREKWRSHGGMGIRQPYKQKTFFLYSSGRNAKDHPSRDGKTPAMPRRRNSASRLPRKVWIWMTKLASFGTCMFKDRPCIQSFIKYKATLFDDCKLYFHGFDVYQWCIMCIARAV